MLTFKQKLKYVRTNKILETLEFVFMQRNQNGANYMNFIILE